MIAFGTRVKVHRIAHRLKAGGYHGDVHTSHRDAIRYVQVVDKGWIGKPLPDTKVDPEHKRAVMIRRYPTPAALTGIVVGKTWREEGYVDEIKSFEMSEGVLMRKGPRIPLFEVALDGDELGKARLVLVHEIDLEVA